MPQRNSSPRTVTTTRLVLFTLAGWLLWALGREPDARGDVTPDPWALDVELDEATGRKRRERPRYSRRRLATTLAFTTLFFAGAALSAGAGDLVVGAVEGEPAAETTTEEAEAPTPAEEPAPEGETAEPEAPAEPAEPAAPAAGEGEEPAEPAEGGEPAPAEEPATGGEPAEEAPASEPAVPEADGDGQSETPEPEPTTGPDPGGAHEEPAPSHSHSGANHGFAPDLEIESEDALATVWLHRDLGDPTPPAKRLSWRFAQDLRGASARAEVDWALVLGVLRASGASGRAPATPGTLARVANRLATLDAENDPWRAALAFRGETVFADKVVALANYNRAVGLRALVKGLDAAKPRLQKRVLSDARLAIYAAGRYDVESGDTNVRVLVLLRYLAEAHGQVTVSSLHTGHGIYSRPGVVSAHTYGLAADIAGLEGKSIYGNQEAGGLTERAVRNILLLPEEVQPKQVISLLGLGGASFPLADHGDHIHVGY
jgi:hypothetical protein